MPASTTRQWYEELPDYERQSCGHADRLASKVGPTGTNVILKLSAFPVVRIGVQILWNGASKLLSSLPQFGGVGALPR